MHHWFWCSSSTLISNPDISAWAFVFFWIAWLWPYLKRGISDGRRKKPTSFKYTGLYISHVFVIKTKQVKCWQNIVPSFSVAVCEGLQNSGCTCCSGSLIFRLAKVRRKIMYFEGGMWTFKNTFSPRVAISEHLTVCSLHLKCCFRFVCFLLPAALS